MDNLNRFNTEDDLTMSWLPNRNEMLKLTLNSSNLFYFPNSFQTDYKVFDVSSQKVNIDNDDEFYSIDQKQGGTKSKVKQPVKKQAQTSNTNNSTNKKVAINNKAPTTTKFKVTQTITIPSDWKSICEFNKQSLDKLRIDQEPNIEEVNISGLLYSTSDDYSKEQVNILNPVSLQRFEEFKYFDNITTSQDEKLKQKENVGNVFITERILSVIMTMIYNSRPWHIKITKNEGGIFFDTTPQSDLDLITVNESAEEIPLDDEKAGINSFHSLSLEATLINLFIKEQILDLNIPYQEEELQPHPFTTDTENLEHSAYRYRIFKLGDLDVVVRAQIHAFNYDENGNPIFINIYALNEFNVNKIFNFRKHLTNQVTKH